MSVSTVTATAGQDQSPSGVPASAPASEAVSEGAGHRAPAGVDAVAGRVVAQIRFIGLTLTSEEAARALIEAREWAAYTPEMKGRDITSLLSSGRFTAVSINEVILSSRAVRLDVGVTEGAPLPPPPAGAPSAAAKALSAVESDEIPPPPWVIGEVGISGNRNVKSSTIRSQIKVRKGDLYERTGLDRDVNNVIALGNFGRVAADITVLRDREVPAHFSAVSPSRHPIKLVFLVEEKPLVEKITFVGNKKISKGRLLDEMELKKRDPFDLNKLRKDTGSLLEEYRKKGFHRAAIKSEVDIDTATLKARIEFRIEEGPKARIAEVNLVGVTAFKSKKLRKEMKNRRKKIFEEKQLKSDLAAVENYYKNRGYLDFEILSSSVTFSDDLSKIFIAIHVEEGMRSLFGDTTFSGHLLYTSTDLAKALDYRPKKVFSKEKFEASIHAVQELYAEKGRLRAVVAPAKTYNEKTKLTDVRFDVTEGPAVYIDHVDVEGYKSTKGYVFKRELLVRPGMLFQVSKIRKSQERIFNLGFIDDIQLDVQSPFEPEKVDLTFEIVEGKPGMLTAGAGFSSLDGLIGTMSLQHLNLFGRAWKTKFSWSFGSRVNDFSLSWTTPWVANRPISLGFDLFNTRRTSTFEGASAGFVAKRTGATVRVGPRFQDDKFHLNFQYSFQKIQTTDVQSQFRDTLAEGASIQSSIGVEAARDTRDNIWDPGRGSRHSVGVTLAGGPVFGDINYLKPYVSNAVHYTLFDIGTYPLVLTLANRGGYVSQFGDTKIVPVFERYFIGGQDTLRGYSAVGEAGFRDGGKVYDVFNVELGFPLARERRKTIVKFVTFFDMGGSWDNVRAVSGRIGTHEYDVKTDVGFGIRFTTPAFPIRLDWGYGFQHRPGEALYQINFGIGNLF